MLNLANSGKLSKYPITDKSKFAKIPAAAIIAIWDSVIAEKL